MNNDDCVGCSYEDTSKDEEPCVRCDMNQSEDVVNHPSHYCQDGGMECIDEMIVIFGKTAVMHFCLLNVWKYRKRAVFKNGKEDMKKADWYMKKYIELGGKAVNVK